MSGGGPGEEGMVTINGITCKVSMLYYVVVQFYPCFKFDFHLLNTLIVIYYHTQKQT